MEIFRRHFGKEWRKNFLSALASELNWPQGAVDKFLTKYLEDYHNFNYPPMPGAKETLQALHKQGIILAIVSNRLKLTLNFRLERAGLNPNIFYQILSPEDTKFRKPDPRVLPDAQIECLKWG